jgi:hypothetical protein
VKLSSIYMQDKCQEINPKVSLLQCHFFFFLMGGSSMTHNGSITDQS